VRVPYTLELVDIKEPENKKAHSRYKWDIPVVHIGATAQGCRYYAKHRIQLEAVEAALRQTSQDGFFEARPGEPG
jgi:hypothetical protein